MQKAKKYDWKDSNMALFGTDVEKQVKKESAEQEPAWAGAGEKVGLQVWRINQFKVEHWPKEDYGKFYSGDSYIILNTFQEKDSEELNHDVHFWIGKESTQDEYGTAAYKTVELDTFLDDKPIQHREVEGHETKLFKSYFNVITYLEGGCATGFRRVLPEEYKPRLLLFSRKNRKITMKEVPCTRSNLKSEDVCLLDTGVHIFQFNGKECSADESYHAAAYIKTIESERNGRCTSETLREEEISPNHRVYSFLSDDVEDDDDQDYDRDTGPEMKRYSDEGGVEDVEFSEDSLKSEDVFMVYGQDQLFVWVGASASIEERRNCMSHGHKYLQNSSHPFASITVIREGKETKPFKEIMALAA